jgi:hypothetical protein
MVRRRADEFDGDSRIADRPFVTLICDFLEVSIYVRDRVTHPTSSSQNGHTRVERCFIGSVGGHQSPYQGWRRMQSPHALSD